MFAQLKTCRTPAHANPIGTYKYKSNNSPTLITINHFNVSRSVHVTHVMRIRKESTPKTETNQTPDKQSSQIKTIKIKPCKNPLEVPVISLKQCRRVASMMLPGYIFAAPLRKDILQRVVTWHLSAKRQGTASTKSRGEVAGSGRKLYAQKGTGNARVGSIRSPVRRGGGPAHGPKPRDWYYPLPRKVRDQGLKSALSSKLAQNKLFIVCDTNVETHKTKNLANILKTLNWEDVLIVEKNKFPRLELAQRNIPKTEYCNQEELSVYSILQRDVLALHRNVLPYLAEKLQPTVKKATYKTNDLLLEVEEEQDHPQNFDEFLKKEQVI